jgi:hypothetical protein
MTTGFSAIGGRGHEAGRAILKTGDREKQKAGAWPTFPFASASAPVHPWSRA